MFRDVDIKILKKLGGNGRMSYLELSRQLDLPNSTIRQRIKRLTDMGVIRFTCEVDPSMFPNIFIMFIGIIVSLKMEKQMNEILKIPNVLGVGSVTGKYDYMTIVAATSRGMAADIIDNKIYKIEGVSHTESFLILKDKGVFIQSDKFCDIFEMGLAQNSKNIKNMKSM